MVGRVAAVALSLLLILTAGCSEAPGPAPASDAAVPEADLPAVVLNVQRSGTVLLRAPGDGPLLQYTGDSPCFEFHLPLDVNWLNGTLSWTPEQTPMMLQFIDLEHVEYYQTQQDVPLSGSIDSPISLSVGSPARADWLAYMGPGAVGGGAMFVLDFTVVAPAGTTVEDLAIADSSC